MSNPSSTLSKAKAISAFAWCHRDRQSDPWRTSTVRAFVERMDCAGYQFNEANFPVGRASISNKWEQVFQWAESIVQNETDTQNSR